MSIIRPDWFLGMAYYLSKIKTPYTLSMHACGAEVEWSASAATGQLKRDHIWGREIEGEPIDFESLTKLNLITKQSSWWCGKDILNISIFFFFFFLWNGN